MIKRLLFVLLATGLAIAIPRTTLASHIVLPFAADIPVVGISSSNVVYKSGEDPTDPLLIGNYESDFTGYILTDGLRHGR